MCTTAAMTPLIRVSLILTGAIGLCSCQFELETQESHTGTEGGSVSLQCTYKNPPPDYTGPIVIVWNDLGSFNLVISYHSGTGTTVIGDLYKDRVSLQGRDADMTIAGLLVADSSIYRCSVNFLQALETAFVETELTVMVPLKSSPTINDVQDGGTITVINNEQATFACKVFSTLPAATFQWAVGGIPQTSSEESTENNGLIDTTSTITYNPQWKNDHGQTVECTAQNTVTTTPFTSKVFMDLLVPPTVVYIEAFNSGDVYTVNEGQPTSLTCTSTAKPAPSLAWFIDNIEMNAESTTPKPNEADDELFDRSSTLSFTPQWSNHMKWVKCVASENIFSQVKIDVNVPVIRILISDVNNMDGFEKGSNVAVADNLQHILICNTSASKPSAEIEWNTGSIDGTVGNTIPTGNHNDERLFDTTQTVTFTPIWANHGEPISCEGGNSANSEKVNTYINLDVQVSPSRATISSQSPQGIITVKDNKTTMISCDAVRARPESSIEWTLGTQIIDNGQEKISDNIEDGFKDTKSTINLKSNYSQDQNKTLKCKAKNYATEAKSQLIMDEIILNVIVGPINVELTEAGNEIISVANVESHITCIAHAAHPEADITWFKGNEDISQYAKITLSWQNDGRKNTISEINFIPTEEDFGKLLTCVGHHDTLESYVSVSSKLIVKYSVGILNEHHDKIIADKGEKATIPCLVSGYPIPIVIWHKITNGTMIELVNGTGRITITEETNDTERYINSSLVIKNVDRTEDYTMYTCFAENEIGNKTHRIILEGRREPDPPREVRIVHELTTWENISVEWMAGNDGGSKQHFSVAYRIAGTIKYNKSDNIDELQYTISDLEQETEYEIYVRARNEIDWSEPSPTVTALTKEKPRNQEIVPKVSNNVGMIIGLTLTLAVTVVVVTILGAMLAIKYRRKANWQQEEAEMRTIPCEEQKRCGNQSMEAKGMYEEISIKLDESDLQTKNMKEATYAALTPAYKSEDIYIKPEKRKTENENGDKQSTYAALVPNANQEDTYMGLMQAVGELNRDGLEVRNVIWIGRHHQIAVARAWHVTSKDDVLEVAVKMAKDSTNSGQERDILKEAAVMKKIQQHSNIVKLLGVCTKAGPAYIITEYLFQGSLETFIREMRSRIFTKKIVTETELLIFARGIAKGLQHLEMLKIVHRYMSPKHILVDNSLHCKISNFGYATSVIESASFYEKAKESNPEKWMSIESLAEGQFSSRSDVWSFGVVLWFITSLGNTPFDSIDGNYIQSELQGGYRLPKPESCGTIAYDLMRQCWLSIPSARPTSTSIVKMLGAIAVSKEFMDVTKVPESVYTVIK